MVESDSDVAGGGGGGNDEVEEQGMEFAQAGGGEKGMERKKQRVGNRQSNRSDHVKKRQQGQIRGLFSCAAEKAATCEKVQDWMVVVVTDDGSIFSQSSRFFEEFCSAQTGLTKVVHHLSNQRTDDREETLKMFSQGLLDAWTHMGRRQAVSLVSGLGMRAQMMRAYKREDVPEHMSRFLNEDPYIDLGVRLEKNMGGRRGERVGDRKFEPGKLLSMDSWVAGVPPSSEEDPGRYKKFSEILCCQDHSKISHAELCALVGIILEWLDPGARVWDVYVRAVRACWCACAIRAHRVKVHSLHTGTHSHTSRKSMSTAMCDPCGWF